MLPAAASIQSSESSPPCSALQSGSDCRIDPDVLNVYVESFSSHLCSLAAPSSQHMRPHKDIKLKYCHKTHPEQLWVG